MLLSIKISSVSFIIFNLIIVFLPIFEVLVFQMFAFGLTISRSYLVSSYDLVLTVHRVGLINYSFIRLLLIFRSG